MIPEYYLLILVVLAAYSPLFHFNPLLLGCAMIPILQRVFKNRNTAFAIASVFITITMYLLTALFSELNNFSAFNFVAYQLASEGLSIWLLNMIVLYGMISNYTNVQKGHEMKISFRMNDYFYRKK